MIKSTTPIKRRKTKNNNYISNKEFYAELVKFFEAYKLDNTTPIPNNIGKAFLMISTNLSKSGNFSGYTWKEEFIGDACELMVKYIHKFNYEKYENAFAYFTTIARNAFLRRIKIENRKIAELQAHRQDGAVSFYTDAQDADKYTYIQDTCKLCNDLFTKETPIKVKIKEEKKGVLEGII